MSLASIHACITKSSVDGPGKIGDGYTYVGSKETSKRTLHFLSVFDYIGFLREISILKHSPQFRPILPCHDAFSIYLPVAKPVIFSFVQLKLSTQSATDWPS